MSVGGAIDKMDESTSHSTLSKHRARGIRVIRKHEDLSILKETKVPAFRFGNSQARSEHILAARDYTWIIITVYSIRVKAFVQAVLRLSAGQSYLL